MLHSVQQMQLLKLGHACSISFEGYFIRGYLVCVWVLQLQPALAACSV